MNKNSSFLREMSDAGLEHSAANKCASCVLFSWGWNVAVCLRRAFKKNSINLFTFQDIVPIFKLFSIVSYLNPPKMDSLKANFWQKRKD